jgi:hypothetical protein
LSDEVLSSPEYPYHPPLEHPFNVSPPYSSSLFHFTFNLEMTAGIDGRVLNRAATNLYWVLIEVVVS